MKGTIAKAEFKEKYDYSESTYHRRMKLFRNSKYKQGYIAPSSNEVYIKTDLYDQFLKDLSDERLGYQIIGEWDG
ncbi:hypothetical protein A5819_003439 [Enterococcus sp. 7E2_DIV0204]|uniref:hypothetical protein n=1 Tax=unclassified Enterococcus TaxID=2608891 RepID=UPI000A32C4A6|nr:MULTISPECIES: hypothetical protein [unclassified Enterococcus]OTN86589.1 hypothetical protein A5819_003439 [Enterococcus sp. 7E2_DIV0204]OTP47622.1 hypothetical protein A5884_003377 [Enterococcus sp. 7D2_DIV0200]